MNQPTRIAVRSLIILLLALGAGTLILSAAVMTPPVQRSIKAAVENLLSNRLGNQVLIGAIHLNWIERFDFRDVVVIDREFGDSMAIHTLHLRFALLPLLKKRLELKRITIQGATITGIRTKRGGVHFPFLSKNSPKVKSSWTYTIGMAVVSGLSARYDDSAAGMYYSLTGIKSRLFFKRLDSLSGTLIAGTGEAITPWYCGRVKNIDIKGELSRKKLVISKGLITGDSSTISCQGTIPFSSKMQWKAHADINTVLSPLLCVRKIKDLQAKGKVRATASLSGFLHSPSIALQVTARNVTFDSLPFETVTAKATYTPDNGLKGTLNLESIIGQANIEAHASIPLLFIKPNIDSWDVSVTADFPRIAEITNRFGLKHALFKGAAHAEAAIGGRGLSELPNHAVVSLALKNSSYQGFTGQIDCNARMNNRQWMVDITADSGNRLHAQGVIGKRNNALSGAFSINITNPASISRLFQAYPVTGLLSCTGDLGGNVKQPTLTLNLRARDLAGYGASIDRLDAAAFYANKRLYINRASLRSDGELAALLPFFGMHDGGGHFHVVADGFGLIGNPNIYAEAGITGLHIGDFTASSLVASLAYRNDTLHWNNIRLGKSTAWIKSSGLACLYGKHRFAKVLIMVERHGYQSASCTASGVSSGDSIDATMSFASMDAGLISPWIKGKMPLHGVVALQAEVHGTVKNPTAQAQIDFKQALGRAVTIRYRAEADLKNGILNALAKACPFGRPESLFVSLSAPLALSPPWTAPHLIRDGARITIEGAEFPLGDLAAQFLPEVKTCGNISMHAVIVKDQGVWNVQGNFAGRVEGAIDSAKTIRIYGLSAEAGIGGTILHPVLTFSVQGDSLYWKTNRFEKPFLQGHGSGEMLYLDTAGVGVYKGHLAFSGSMPWEVGRLIINKSHLSLQGVAEAVPLAVFAPFVPDADFTKGTIGGDVTLTVRENRPYLQGRLSVRDAGFKPKGFETAVGPIDAELSLRGDSIIVKSLQGRIGSSGLFSGTGSFEPASPGHLQFGLSATDCPLQLADLNAVIRTASIRLADSANALVLGGNVTLAESRYQLFLSPTALFQKAPAPKPKKIPSKNSLLRRIALRMVVDLDKNLTIESNIGSLTLDGIGTIVGNPERPGIVGTISVSEGYIYYLDKKFNVQQGTFRFTNPDDLNPAISLIATDTITSTTAATSSNTAPVATSSGAGTEQTYVITLTVSDSLRKPTVVLSSNPPLQPEFIVSLITFGTTQGIFTNGVTTRIAGLLAQQLAGFGTRPLQQLLNIESLNVETQATGGPTVTAIKRISPRLSVTYQAILQNLGRPNVAASYRLLPNLYIIGSGYYLNSGIDLHLRLSR
jgi:hypothetical protein